MAVWGCVRADSLDLLPSHIDVFYRICNSQGYDGVLVLEDWLNIVLYNPRGWLTTS